jgi:serine/threonine-protein kinase
MDQDQRSTRDPEVADADAETFFDASSRPPTIARQRSWLGRRVGSCQVVAFIGAGGMGEVYRARDTRLDRDVAIKVLPPALGVAADRLTRFEREARLLAALSHPGIAAIYSLEESDGVPALVLEHVEGPTLAERLAVDALDEADAIDIAIQLADALHAAHSNGIVHRDLKPANIKVSPGRIVKVLDFGLARPSAEPGQLIEGTPAYMSPEQVRGEPVDPRTDIWAFGCVLYEMVSGRRAFDRASTADTFDAVLRTDPESIGESRLASIVERCLRKRPEDRFARIVDAREALVRILPKQGRPSIAVLPFVNATDDVGQEYFSDGLTEEIIARLAEMPGVRVIARTSAFAFKGQAIDVRRVAESLGVDHVLEGTVRKTAGGTRVTTQLLSAATGSAVWCQRYERDVADMCSVQDEIAVAICESLRVALETPRARPPEPARAADEALLKGRHQLLKLTKESIGLAGEYFVKATQIDPGYAAAHAWLGSYHWLLASAAYAVPALSAMPRAREAARRAVELDPSSADAHAVLCAVAAELDYDWVEADRRFRLATSMPTLSPEGRRLCGFNYLLSVGRPLDAAHECERALRDDPLNALTTVQVGVCLHAAGEPGAALERFRQALELNERNFLAHLNIALWMLEQHRLSEAAAAADAACAVAPVNPWSVACQAALRTLTGDHRDSSVLLESLGPPERYGTPAAYCRYFMLTGDFEMAATWAARGIMQRDAAFPFALQMSCARAFRASDQWPAIAAMMNLDRVG